MYAWYWREGGFAGIMKTAEDAGDAEGFEG